MWSPDICGVGEREEWDDDESEWGEDSKWNFKDLNKVLNITYMKV